MDADRDTIRVVSAEIQEEGCYLLTQRSAKAVLPLLWEFPGGRVRSGESDIEALARSLRYRLGVGFVDAESVLEVRHDYDDYSVILVVYRCDLTGGPPIAQAVNALAWVAPEDFGDYPFPDADQRTIEQLLREDLTELG